MTKLTNNLDELIVEDAPNGWKIIRLNRPHTLHALNLSLIRGLSVLFNTFAQDENVKAIWLDSTTPKAFCAGGDVRKIREYVLDGHHQHIAQFFEEQATLDLLLHQYKKPIVVWGEGYVMGGGLGLFMAAPFRLVAKYSRLAMPEINIGLYPDVGGTRFLSDRGIVGLFTGLTGSVMTSAGAYAIGWATHICETDRQHVLNTLFKIEWETNEPCSFRAIEDVLGALHRPTPAGPLQNSLDVLYHVCKGIDFIQDYNGILTLAESRSDWLRQASESLQKGSIVTAALTWLLWQWGKIGRTWKEVLELEKQISIWKVEQPDFIEGVRARLVDKDLSPKWFKPIDLSLPEIFLQSQPITTISSWNNLLKYYHVIE